MEQLPVSKELILYWNIDLPDLSDHDDSSEQQAMDHQVIWFLEVLEV